MCVGGCMSECVYMGCAWDISITLWAFYNYSCNGDINKIGVVTVNIFLLYLRSVLPECLLSFQGFYE